MSQSSYIQYDNSCKIFQLLTSLQAIKSLSQGCMIEAYNDYLRASIEFLAKIADAAYVDQNHDFDGGFKFVTDSRDIKNTGGYKGKIWVCDEKKTLVISHSGTKMDKVISAFKDLVNDCQVAFGCRPTQFDRGAAKFVKNKIKLDKYKDYKIFTIGHSLGAIISDLCLVDLKNLGFNDVTSITFDSPGSERILSEYLKTHSSLQVDRDSFYVINGEPNSINTLDDHMGHVVQVGSGSNSLMINLFSINSHYLSNFFNLKEKKFAKFEPSLFKLCQDSFFSTKNKYFKYFSFNKILNTKEDVSFSELLNFCKNSCYSSLQAFTDEIYNELGSLCEKDLIGLFLFDFVSFVDS